jgi:hypothetical protein
MIFVGEGNNRSDGDPSGHSLRPTHVDAAGAGSQFHLKSRSPRRPSLSVGCPPCRTAARIQSDSGLDGLPDATFRVPAWPARCAWQSRRERPGCIERPSAWGTDVTDQVVRREGSDVEGLEIELTRTPQEVAGTSLVRRRQTAGLQVVCLPRTAALTNPR